MRIFANLTLLIVTTHVVIAAPLKPVFHAHAGRNHNHVLPANGVSHRHNGGASGVIAKSTNGSPRITSTVAHGSKPEPKPKTYSDNNTRNSGQIRSQTVQIKNNQKPYGKRLSKGDVNCRAGEPDCNVCAVSVQQQFKKAAAGQISWRTKPWRFTWPQSYPPYNKRPLDIFDGDPAYALGIPDKHVQGFVRTNSSRFPYAGSHSHKRQGGIFVIRQISDGKKYLSSLHPTRTKHPSGVHAFGKYLVYGEKNTLVFKDLNSHAQQNDIRLSIRGANFGGGLGVLRLSKDNYLLVTSGPGGQDSRPRFNRFYHLKGQNGRPRSITTLSHSPVSKVAGWPQVLGFSENLSLITECGTGDVFAVNTTGDEKGVKAIRGKGYWKLSKLNTKNGRLQFDPINAFSTQQNMSSCNIRAAATVFVNRHHKLEFYCHGYAKDPDGSMFNVLGGSSRGADKFNFKVGVVH